MPSVVDNSDDDEFDGCIFPLTDLDGDNNNHVGAKFVAAKERSDLCQFGYGVGDAAAGGRLRRVSVGCPFERTRGPHSAAHPIPLSRQVSLKLSMNGLHNGASGNPLSPLSSSPKVNWMQAIKKIKQLKDPWERFHILDLPTETAIRHRYHALKKQWVVDKVEVKVERQVNKYRVWCLVV
jgi:hypothetical protein